MRRLTSSRAAFSMVTAIFVILILATIGAFIMNLSGKIVQETTAQYRKEQAILWAKSYTEFTIMTAASEPCVRNITANVDGNNNQVKQGQGYRVEVRVRYLGQKDSNNTCNNRIGAGIIATPSAQENIILIDTYVRYRDPESIGAKKKLAWSKDPGITYHRRTLQRL